jgi:asparagine synthase (glutamine-hydrolysing)
VTVSLSGDAGDELFAGYERYVRGAQVARVPAGLRMAAGAVLRGMPASTLEAGASAVGRVLPRRLRLVRAGEKLAKLAPVLGEGDAHRMYEGLVTHWRGESPPVIASADAASPGFLGAHVDPSLPFEQWMMLVDQHGYLPDDILVKLDRAAMAVSLETRVPLLDHTLVEHAWRVPLSLKLRDGRGKHLLRSLLTELVPAALIERPKRGFAVPLAAWLRGPLRAWGDDLLDEASLRRQGLFDAGRIRKRWREHLDGSRNAHDELWPILCFQAWRAAYG